MDPFSPFGVGAVPAAPGGIGTFGFNGYPMFGFPMDGMAAMRSSGFDPAMGAFGGPQAAAAAQMQTNASLVALATILLALMQNQGMNPNLQNGGCPNCSGNNSGAGGGGGFDSASGGGGGGGSDLSAGAPNPNTQIPSGGSNPDKGQVEQMLNAAAQKYGIPPDILKAIAWKESGWKNSANGDGGKSFGIMQIYTKAHPDYDSARGQQDASYNIEYGAKLLRSLYDRYKDWKLAVLHYNGSGPMAERYANDVFGNLLPNKPWGR